tara:strand:- start:4398 stop:4595 length:198 start_codon:yes stop_codon:yes gene_type:complete
MEELNERGINLYWKDTIKVSIYNQVIEEIMKDVMEFEKLPVTIQLQVHTIMRTAQRPHLHLAKDC